MTLICYENCSTCKKAQKWLDTHSISYTLRDIKEDRPTEEELREWHRISGLPLRKFFNTSGQQYRALALHSEILETFHHHAGLGAAVVLSGSEQKFGGAHLPAMLERKRESGGIVVVRRGEPEIRRPHHRSTRRVRRLHLEVGAARNRRKGRAGRHAPHRQGKDRSQHRILVVCPYL